MEKGYFFKKLKDVKFADILSGGKMLVALVQVPFVKKKYSGVWVVCETTMEARDNGYHFFKYMRTAHPEHPTYYAISLKSSDYGRVEKLGNVIEYGSVKHWLLYLCANYNISSQKGGKPNTALCAFLELYNMIDSKFVFLQHGVTINDVVWAHADVTQLRYFITSTTPECQFIKEKFGYRPDQIVLTGMPRFDNLHDVKVNKKQIVIMPTWRARFSLKSEKDYEDNNFLTSAYKREWEALLNSPKLHSLVKKHDLKILFFPHRNMQQFLDDFDIDTNYIKIAKWEEYEIQSVLKESAMMITDYSSVFFDMVYMKKPVIVFQFDYNEFRNADYKEGYFDYKNNPFSCSFDQYEQVITELEKKIQANYAVDVSFEEEHRRIFPYYDQNNSERIYQLLMHKEENYN